MAHIFFDLDGTLTDSAPGITRCLHHAVRSVGGTAPEAEDLARFIGTPLVEIFETLLPGSSEAGIRVAIEAYAERFDRVGIRENAVYPGIEDLLGELRADGHTLYVATAKLAQTGRQVIELFELAGHFLEVHGSPGGPRPVEKHEILMAAIRQHELTPEDVVMVGDRHYDVRAAKQLGGVAIGVAWGYGDTDELEHAAADAIAREPAEIQSIVRSFAR